MNQDENPECARILHATGRLANESLNLPKRRWITSAVCAINQAISLTLIWVLFFPLVGNRSGKGNVTTILGNRSTTRSEGSTSLVSERHE